MQYSMLGETGFLVSRLGLGGAPIGGDFGEISDKQAIDVVHAALDLGINFIDTAPLYGRGESERRIGQALKGRRNSVILATKAVMRGDPYTYDNTIRSVEDSLRRLQTDWVDLIQLHEMERTSYELAMHETLPAFQKLREQGKVRAIGVNAGNVDLLLPFIKEGAVDTIQTYARYTLIDYTAKDRLFPLAQHANIGVIHGSPLAMGILADAPAPFMLKDATMLAEAQRRMSKLAFLRKKEPGGLVEPAMRFSLTCPDITVTLTGASSVESLRENAGYADGKGLSSDELGRVLELFPEQRL